MFLRTRRLRRVLGGDADELTPVCGRAARHRLRYTIIALLCIGAVAWMVTLMQKNVVFFKTVNRRRSPIARTTARATMRIGGAVVPGTIKTPLTAPTSS